MLTLIFLLLLASYSPVSLALPRPPQNASSLRIVYSLTTNPSRIHTIEQTINSLLRQEVKPDIIQVNVPWVFRRTNETFDDLASIEILKHPLVKVHRCRDYGPITKLVGALETEHDSETLIIVLDDDYEYPAHLTRIMKQWAAEEPDFVLSGKCGDTMLSNPESDFWGPPFNFTSLNVNKPCCCRFFEGFGAAGYRVRFFQGTTFQISIFPHLNVNFTTYFETAIAHKRCFRTDDLVISNFLTLLGIQGIDLKIRVKELKANRDDTALYLQKYQATDGAHTTPGHPYYNCSMYLRSLGMSYLKLIIPEFERENVPVVDGALLQCENDRTVYLIQNHTRRAFYSGQAFMKMGFSFSNVKKILRVACQTELYYIPPGPDII